jgi:hypothetical protein
MADARVGTYGYCFRFLDWRPGDQEAADGGTASGPTWLHRRSDKAQPAKSPTWLYIFQASSKRAHLHREVLLRPATGGQPEMYLEVDLKQHWGKDPRPVIEPGEDCVWLDDGSNHVLEELRYYILVSPFQLHWSRIEKLASTSDPGELHRLAKEERGLRRSLLDATNTRRGPGNKIRIKAIWSPWGQAQALQRQYNAKWNEWNGRACTRERIQWRTLLAAIDMLGKIHRFSGLLDEDYLKNEVYAALLADEMLFRKVNQLVQKLVDFLKGPAMTAIDLDVRKTTDPDAHKAYAEIKEPTIRKIQETEIGRQYKEEWFAEHHDLVLFDAAAAFSVTRKVSSAIFTWAKSWADVAAGYPKGSKHAGEIPRGFEWWARRQAGMFTNVHLVADCGWFETVAEDRARKALTPAEFEEWNQRRNLLHPPEGNPPKWAAKLEGLEPVRMKFSKESVAQLKAAINERPMLNGLFAAIDAINVAFTLRALFDEDAGSGTDKLKKRAAAASGICSFLKNALGLAKSGTLHLTTEELAELQKLRATSLQAHDLLKTYETQGKLRRGVARVASRRALGIGLGGIGAAADMVTFGSDLLRGQREARTGGSSDRIWIWPGLGFAGSMIACAGYAIAFVNPVGAVAVALGSLLSTAATVGSVAWPGVIASEVEKWLMHSFVGKYRKADIAEDESFTNGKSLVDYHKDLDLQIAALDHVLFEFEPKCELHEEAGKPLLKIDIHFRQLKCRSKVELKVFGYQDGKWLLMFHSKDWQPRIRPPEDRATGLRQEGFGRMADNVPAAGFAKMKIEVQIDLFGDGSFLYPKRAKDAFA